MICSLIPKLASTLPVRSKASIDTIELAHPQKRLPLWQSFPRTLFSFKKEVTRFRTGGILQIDFPLPMAMLSFSGGVAGIWRVSGMIPSAKRVYRTGRGEPYED